MPVALKAGPFSIAQAKHEGVTRGRLRGAGYRRLGAGLYRWAGLNESPQLMLAAVARRLPADAAFSGLTAAWLHGLDVAPCDPIEVTIPERSAVTGAPAPRFAALPSASMRWSSDVACPRLRRYVLSSILGAELR